MAKKPKITPIAVAMKKAEKERPPEPPPGPPPFEIPPSLAARKVTANSIANGNYQNAMRAACAPQVLLEYFRSLVVGIKNVDPSIMRQAGEVYQMLGGKGVNINLQQNNVNQTANVSASRDKGITSPDDMFRMLAAEREQRLLNPGRTVDLVATPAGYDKVKTAKE